MKPQPTLRLLVTSGNGPAECCLAVSHVLQRIGREAKDLRLDCDITLSDNDGSRDPSSALVMLRGEMATTLGQQWLGTIKWTVKSPFRPCHKRRNWFVGVFILGPETESRMSVERKDVQFETFRAGGPGGQHQNKTDSAVRATHLPTGLSLVSRDQRSQHRNKEVAFDRLSAKLLLMHSREHAKARSDENQIHGTLERGNPVRRFKGVKFVEI